MRRLAPALALLLAACGGHQLAQCPANQPAVSLNSGPLALSVWDDGNNTWLRFPGNTHIPPIYTGEAATVERPADTTVEQGGLVMMHGTAPQIRLRDGDRVACLMNNAYNPVGNPSGSKTSNPDVARVPREAAR